MKDLRQLRLPLDDLEDDLVLTFNQLRDIQKPFLERLDHLNCEKDTLARYGAALMIETAEFVNETKWKTWKSYPYETDQEYVDILTEEFADIVAFLGTWVNLMDQMGIPTREIARAYVRKTQKNHERFEGTSGEAGYTGIVHVGLVQHPLVPHLEDL